MTDTVLFVDDERHILSSLKRLFMDDDVEILTAATAFEALDIINSRKIPVIVSDNIMPGMTGIEFFQKVKGLSSDSVRILMTAHADLQSALDAINKGEVFRFITKPWDDTELKKVVFDAIARYKIVQSLRRADEATLLSLAQTVELKDHYTKGHCDRVAAYAAGIANALQLSDEQQKHIKYGSWLHDCGKIGVPESILNSPAPLSPEEQEVIRNHCQWGADVARLAQLPEVVINIILYHHERYDGQGYPFRLKGAAIPLEARIVAVADAYDALTSNRPYRKGVLLEEGKNILIANKGSYFDPDIVDNFIEHFGDGPDAK